MTLRFILAAGAALTLATAAGAQAPATAPATAPAPAPVTAPETTGSVTGSNAAASGLRQITVEALEDMELVAADGKEIGEIEGVVEAQDGKRFVLVERGGILGFGAKEIAVPIENVVVQGEKLMLRNMDVAALDGMPAFKNENSAFRELAEDQQIGLAQQQ